MLFIGDVHGKWHSYLKILEGNKGPSVQVGDFGVGFPKEPEDLRDDLFRYMADHDHRFLRGNHDNPETCLETPACIPDGTVEGNMMFVGGALSVDRGQRTEGVDYWLTEELSIPELGDMIDIYESHKPDIMVTHDIPQGVAQHLFSKHGLIEGSRTRQAFEQMFEIHKPKKWIFGHWHKSVQKNILGTEFICLNELETYRI